MKIKNILYAMLVCMVLGIPLILPMQVSGVCVIGYEGIGEEDEQDRHSLPPYSPRTIKDVEEEISHTQEGIDERSRQAFEEREKAARLGWGILAGSPQPYREKLISRAAELEKENHQMKRELAELEEEKRRLVKEARGCFLPDTLVTMADGSVKPFKRLQPGEHVLTYDIGYQTTVNKPVVEVYTVEGNHLYTINGELTTTGGERLLSRTGWKQVSDLHKGDFVHMNGRMVEIATIDYQRTDNTLYNIQVGDSHNFYVVTDNGSRYLVHNSSGGGGGGGAGK